MEAIPDHILNELFASKQTHVLKYLREAPDAARYQSRLSNQVRNRWWSAVVGMNVRFDSLV